MRSSQRIMMIIAKKLLRNRLNASIPLHHILSQTPQLYANTRSCCIQ